jgi:methyltransferase OMS1
MRGVISTMLPREAMVWSRCTSRATMGVTSMMFTQQIRYCATKPPAEGGAASSDPSKGASEAEKPADNGDLSVHEDKGIKPQRSSFLEPSDDVVMEFARRALVRDGRDKVAESIIWKEDTSYPPILSQGKKNVYDYTDDIPKHVKPFWGHEWYQQREYFEAMRNRKPFREKVRNIAGGVLIFLIGAAAINMLRIYVHQPKEIQAMRSELLQNSYGKVLELAAGHGQNIGMYPYPVHEIVMSDSNAQQLQTLRYRIPTTAYPKYQVRKMRSEMLEDFGDAEFDTVIDMFGLCHYHDPVMALRQMQRVVKPTGIILLLEHGATRNTFVNMFLDFFEKKHLVNTHGCKWNQPMLDILKDSNIEVKELKTKHYGTTYYVVAYPENMDALAENLKSVELAQ